MSFRDQCRSGGLLAGERVSSDATVECERKDGEHARVARELQPARRHLLPRAIVPQVHRGLDGDPQPPKGFVVCGASQADAASAPLCSARLPRTRKEPRRQAIEEEVGVLRVLRLRRG